MKFQNPGLNFLNGWMHTYRTFSKKDHFFGQKISKILFLVFYFISIYYMLSEY